MISFINAICTYGIHEYLEVDQGDPWMKRSEQGHPAKLSLQTGKNIIVLINQSLMLIVQCVWHLVATYDFSWSGGGEF